MTQTVGAMNFRKAIVAFGAATASLTTITGQLCAVAVSGGERGGSVGHTSDGDFPIIAAGKVAPTVITVRFLYTEVGTSEAFDVAQDIWETAGAACFLRYTPSGGTGSEYIHKTANAAGAEAAGYMSAFEQPPPGEVGSGDLLRGSFSVICARIVSSAVA